MADTRVQHHRAPPVEQGQTLAIFDRNRGTERLRVSLETYNGFDFVRLQAWQLNEREEWWPAKGRCVTIKTRECDDLAVALTVVARRQGDRTHDRPQRASSRRGTS